MYKRLLFSLLISVFAMGITLAQGWSFGFRAGLNYSKLLGPFEMNDAGVSLENYKMTNGFHIGGTVNYAFTDRVGVRADIIFSQLGTQYQYEGESYYFLANGTENSRKVTGMRKVDLNVSQAAFEVPLMIYYKLGPVEVMAGIDAAIIAASNGGGTLDFEGTGGAGQPEQPFRVTMTHNYNKDQALGQGLLNQQVKVDGTTILTASQTGAYYDYNEKNGNWYNTIQLGLTAGLSFYLNDGLYVGGRVIYGLTDADDNYYDISYYKLNPDNTYIQRSDKNTNLTIQATLGFLFGSN